MGVWTIVTGFLGFSANSLAIIVFVKSPKVFKIIFLKRSHHHSQLRTPFNYLLMNLSMTELIISVTGHPFLAYNSFAGEWSFGPTLCKLNALSMTYLGFINYIRLGLCYASLC